MKPPRARDIFMNAIGLDGADRAAYLDQACGDDAALRSEVEKLLAEDDRQQKRQQDGQQDGRHDHATTPVQPGSAGHTGSSEAPRMIGLDVGDSIDGFKILEVIGEGGMGVVYLAEQLKPVKRRIALKVIKPGMDTKAVLARFEAERQALALMDHPGIARVLQAGTTDRGLPYFAMEYVKGVPITDAADRNQLDTTQRLELMQKVCDAVQHAHMKGIIHRDLKPSNVLVTSDENDQLVAKIIDFGVAKATTQQLTELTVHTQVGHFIGTPAYMSPEQADLTAADIDTRTDVYSLGVILYELLTGQLPFDPGELREAGLEEMRRRIREDDPPKPSTRLTSLDEKTATRISRARRTRLDQLQKNLASELDWIPLKALRKLRSERYATPNDLGRDLQRYLDGDPLEAGPESTGYRLRKFVARRRLPIAVGGAFAAILVMATAVSGWLAVEASRARDETLLALEQAAAEREKATAKAEELEIVSEFQSDMLSGIDISALGFDLERELVARYESQFTGEMLEDDGRENRISKFKDGLSHINMTDVSAEMIDNAILRRANIVVTEKFQGQPLIDARLRQSLASVYHDIGKYDKAALLLKRSFDIHRSQLGESHDLTLQASLALCSLLHLQGFSDEAVRILRGLINGTGSSVDPGHHLFLEIRWFLGEILVEQGLESSGLSGEKLDEAERLLLDVIDRSRQLESGEDNALIQAKSYSGLGMIFEHRGDLVEAEKYCRWCLDRMRDMYGELHEETLVAKSRFGRVLLAQGKGRDALPLLFEVIESRRYDLGDGHPKTLHAFWQIVEVLSAEMMYREAEEYQRDYVAACRMYLGDADRVTIDAITKMGDLFYWQDEYKKAEPLYREALETSRRTLGDEEQVTIDAITNMGNLFYVQDEYKKAEPLYREALETSRRTLGDEHPDTLFAIGNMANLFYVQDEYKKAAPLYREALETSRRTLGDEEQVTIDAITNMGNLFYVQDEYKKAEPLYREALEASRRTLGDEHPDTLAWIDNMALLFYHQGRYADAEPLYREAIEGSRRTLGDEHPDTLRVIGNVANLFYQQRRYADAKPLYREAIEGSRRTLGDEHLNTIIAIGNMALLFSDQARYAEAEPLYREALEAIRRTLGDEHPQTQRLMQTVPAFYDAWDAAEPGQGHAATADALRAEFGLETASPAEAEAPAATEEEDR